MTVDFHDSPDRSHPGNEDYRDTLTQFHLDLEGSYQTGFGGI